MPNYGAGSFNSELKQLMVDYGTTKAGKDDALSNVQSEIDDVRKIMTQNIDQVLARGERIDLLVDKTDRLGGSAHEFRVRSKTLRRQMWWKNIKLMVLLSIVVIFLLYLFIGFGCGLRELSLCSKYPISIILTLNSALGEVCWIRLKTTAAFVGSYSGVLG